MTQFLIANVILPAFGQPYLAGLVSPLAWVAALSSELIVAKAVHHQVSLDRLIPVVALANVASWVVGFASSPFLPSGMDFSQGPPRLSPQWALLVVLAFVVAYLVSILVEWVVCRRLARDLPSRRWLLASWLMNTVSYVTLVGLLALGLRV